MIVAAALVAACASPATIPFATAPLERVTVNGAELAYIQQGDGDVVIFLHSVAADLRVWEGVRQRLRDYRFVAYSRRHHAPNAWPDDGASHTLDQHVEDLVALVDRLRVGRVHLVALGLGARVATHAVIRYPRIAATLTVGDGVLALPSTEQGERDLEAFAAAFAPVEDRIDARDEAGTAVAVVDWLLAEQGGWQALSALRRRPYLDNARTLFLVRRDATLRAPGCEALRTLDIPVLVLAGERTPAALRATNAETARCARHAVQAEVPGSGHLWYADNPDEGVLQLEQFLGKQQRR